MKTLFLSIFTLLTFSVFAQNQSQDINVQKIEVLLNEYLIKNNPGIAISVVKDGNVIYKKNKGYSNLEHMIPITDSTKFVVGSISKQFTAFSILLLEDEGKLSIDDDITKYLPELNGLPYNITIRHFLNHTSGFRDNTDLNSLKGRTDLDCTSQTQMVNLLLRQKGLNFIPGSRFQYCNSGYVLLAEIVKRVSGMTFAKFAHKRIFKPLSMKNSLFLDDPSLVVKNKALSYVKQNNEYYYIPINRSIVGSTGLYTTISDLSLWANNFDNPIIGSNSIFKKMETKSRLNDGEIIPYALGQELKIYKGLDVIFHGGGDAGYRSYLLRVPEHKLNIVVSGNFESFNPLNISYGLLDVFLSNYIKEPIKKERPNYTNKTLKKFEGDYQVFPGLYITILAEQDSLFFKSYGYDDKLKLPVSGKNEFEFPARAHSKLKFIKDSLNWHFSDFYYPAKKVTLNPPKYANIDLQELKGIYKSDEVETSYEFIIKDNKLIATHNFNRDIELKPIDKDSFITDLSYISRIEFTRNSKGNIDGCKISGQNSYDVLFSLSE
ncbi:serine hydrolase domain-containing protein [Flavivirga abyssicola]|uniref:serine hydrolase domain-containing protein n=1 Tax=Flavivirga abyssicola TaxID=3063533 RepID=UPI0026DF9925|nr:serine hydrolase domain-containing protein [Flavivirga sp. MEBiC07777]WVK14642.1 serine hydrolase domain-containing protein [Flavivirga sp. MEBiC07777]